MPRSRPARDDLDVALITTSHDHHELQRLCAAIRSDAELFDLPVLLVGRAQHFTDRAQPFAWGVSDVLFQPFHPEVLRLRVQAWVRQQRLRRHLRSCLAGLPDHRSPDPTVRPRFLHAYVGHLIEQAARTGGALAVISVAVAQMRQINQLYGYAAGDRVLATLGAALVRFSRAEDLPARLDSDRFCLVIDNATARDAGAAAERPATCSPTPPSRWPAIASQVSLGPGSPSWPTATMPPR